MKIKFKEFANMGEVIFSDDSDLTLLIGDNGVGKTFLLEAYSKTNDLIVEHFIESEFFEELLDTAEYEIDLVDSKKNLPILPTDFLGRLSDSGKFVDEKGLYVFDVKIKNIEILQEKIICEVLRENDRLSQQIKEEVFFNEMDLSGFDVNISDQLECLQNQATYEMTYFIRKQIQGLESTEETKNNYFEKDISIYSVKLSGRSEEGYMLADISEIEDIQESIAEKDYSVIEKLIKSTLVEEARRSFVEKNNLRNIIYIPSERVISMSEALEKVFKKAMFNDLRYSEEKFMNQYTLLKEMMSRSSLMLKRRNKYSKEYINLLGGIPIFNEDGEVAYIEDSAGNRTKRSLFSTKQNKLFSFFILENNMGGISNQRKSSSLENMVIIEEPEAHLSLRGVFQIVDYITYLSKTRKVIVSTHSDVFVSKVNNYYLNNKDKITLSGYEILNRKPKNIFKPVEMGEYGLRSDFIHEQLNILFEETNVIQGLIDGLEEV